MKLSELDGIGPKTEEKLAEFGILDVMQLLTRSPPQIAEMTDMDLESAKNLFRKAVKRLEEDSLISKRIKSGTEIEKERKDVQVITTGTLALDKLFERGVEVGATTEIYGEFGSGKTQFCHTMAVRVQLPKDKGGLEGKAFWIDTENTFRPERIRSIAGKLEMDQDTALDNIVHAKARNSAEQYLILEELEQMLGHSENIKLIIVDSSTGLFRSDYIGRGRLSDRQGQLNYFLTYVKNISETYHCACILTNQVMKDPGQMFGDPTKPIGGDILAHSSTYRVYFKKSGKNRVAKMIDSPHHAETEVMFALNERGVVDVDVRDSDKKEAEKLLTKEKRKLKKDE